MLDFTKQVIVWVHNFIEEGKPGIRGLLKYTNVIRTINNEAKKLGFIEKMRT